jgi:hypothetical protein
MRNCIVGGLVAAFGLGLGPRTGAEVVATFSYDSLLGSYDAQGPNQGVFTARAVDQPLLRTVGDFNRTISPEGNADFPAGFVADANLADIFLEMTNTRTSATTFSAVGSLTITDIDGDQFLTGFTGTWYILGPGFAFFNVDSTNNLRLESDDGFFNGYNGSWSIAGLTNLEWTFNNVIIGGPGFDQDFSDFAVGVSGYFVPTPPAAAALIVGLAALGSRRRSRRA